MTNNPSALCIEIKKHEDYLTLIDAGLIKRDRTYAKRKRYVENLKQELLRITDPGDDNVSDEELLEQLSI